MDNNLLVSLRKYKPTAGRDPIENFVTEAFAWLLKQMPAFSQFYIQKIMGELNCDFQFDNAEWKTQDNFNGFFPDLVCTIGKNVLIFEHKVWSSLHDGQLANYRNYALKYFDNHKLILITGGTIQDSQNADLAIRWRHVHSWVDEWIKKDDIRDHELFVFGNFLHLLEMEGLGPTAPISHESIFYYLRTRNFLRDVEGLIDRVYKERESIFKNIPTNSDFKVTKCYKYGRLGLQLFDSWTPSIFIGVLANWEDHAVMPILGDTSPDFVVLLDFDQYLHDTYPSDNDYKDLLTELENKVNNSSNGWCFYNHLADKSVNSHNKWHPVYVRKPLIQVLIGTKTAEDQVEQFIICAKEILPFVLESEYFIQLRNKYKPEVVYL